MQHQRQAPCGQQGLERAAGQQVRGRGDHVGEGRVARRDDPVSIDGDDAEDLGVEHGLEEVQARQAAILDVVPIGDVERRADGDRRAVGLGVDAPGGTGDPTDGTVRSVDPELRAPAPPVSGVECGERTAIIEVHRQIEQGGLGKHCSMVQAVHRGDLRSEQEQCASVIDHPEQLVDRLDHVLKLGERLIDASADRGPRRDVGHGEGHPVLAAGSVDIGLKPQQVVRSLAGDLDVLAAARDRHPMEELIELGDGCRRRH